MNRTHKTYTGRNLKNLLNDAMKPSGKPVKSHSVTLKNLQPWDPVSSAIKLNYIMYVNKWSLFSWHKVHAQLILASAFFSFTLFKLNQMLSVLII